MKFRFSPWVTGVLVVVTVALMTSRGWAYFYELGPSKDEWGLKYDAEVTPVDSDKLNVHFTLANAGRLNPIYSVTVIAFSNPRSDGFRTYLLNAKIELQPTKDGKLTGQVLISKEHANRAVIRILTQTLDGQPQTAGARYYDIPLKKYLNKTPAVSSQTPPSIASPPELKVLR